MPKKLKIKFEEIQASALFAGVSPKIIKKNSSVSSCSGTPGWRYYY